MNNHKEFESWIKDDGGVIKKVTSPSKVFEMSDEDEDEQDQNDSKHQEKRHSIKEREQLRLELIRLRMAKGIEDAIANGIIKGWKAAFRASDHMNTGKLELQHFTSAIRSKFMLPSDPQYGGITDRELRDIFFEVDRIVISHFSSTNIIK